jgi:hypothetical protein
MSPIISARTGRFGGGVRTAARGRRVAVLLRAIRGPCLPRDIGTAALLIGVERDFPTGLIAGSAAAIPDGDHHQHGPSLFRRIYARTPRPPCSSDSQSLTSSTARVALPNAAYAT